MCITHTADATLTNHVGLAHRLRAPGTSLTISAPPRKSPPRPRSLWLVSITGLRYGVPGESLDHRRDACDSVFCIKRVGAVRTALLSPTDVELMSAPRRPAFATQRQTAASISSSLVVFTARHRGPNGPPFEKLFQGRHVQNPITREDDRLNREGCGERFFQGEVSCHR